MALARAISIRMAANLALGGGAVSRASRLFRGVILSVTTTGMNFYFYIFYCHIFPIGPFFY